MDQINYNNTGAIERPAKMSDLDIGSFTPTAEAIPEEYLPAYPLKINMQGQQPACGAHAGATVRDILDADHSSPWYAWKKIKLIDGYPIESGTDLPSIMKVLSNGICEFDLTGNDVTVSLQEYADASKISPAMSADAGTRKMGAYAFQFKPTIDQLKAAIYAHKAVIMLLQVGKEFWTDANGVSSWQEKDILPLNPKYPVSSGHFVTAYAYDKNYIYFANEWSTAWGRQGYGYFGADYMPRVYEIGTIVDVAKYTFTKTLKEGMTGPDVSMLQKVLRDNALFPPTQSITGNFFKVTLAAVKALQQKHDLKADGIVGPMTNSVLNSLIQ